LVLPASNIDNVDIFSSQDKGEDIDIFAGKGSGVDIFSGGESEEQYVTSEPDSFRSRVGRSFNESQKNIATLATKGASKLIDIKQNIIDSDVDRVKKKADIELVNANIVNLNAQAEKRLAEAFAEANEKDYPKLQPAVDNAVRNGWKDMIIGIPGVSLNEDGTLDIKGDQIGDPKKVSELRANLNDILVEGAKYATSILMDDDKSNDVGAISSAMEIMSKKINKLKGGTPTTPMTQADVTASLAILKPQGRSIDPESLKYKAEIQRIKKEHGNDAVKEILKALEN